jgi:nitrile hydratase accessory protein
VEIPVSAGMPPIPMDETGPVFREPWEAQAFAIVLKLYQEGRFTWPEWVDTLSAEIKAAQRAGDPDLGNTYYHHWLAALEKLLVSKGMTAEQELSARRAEIEANPPDRHHHNPRREPVAIG